MLDNLTKRVGWAIETIPNDKDLDLKITDVVLAKILGTNKNTLAKYRNQEGPPKGDVIDNLISHYNFNPMWLFKGEGEPFPGARKKYEDVCGPEEPAIIRESSPNYGQQETLATHTAPVYGPEIRISDAIIMCTKVLESGTSYATALYLNIQHFERAVNAEIFGKKCQDDLIVVSETITKMQKRMDEMEKENKILQTEMKKLRDSSGGCAPIELNQGDAALTGTDAQET